MRRLLAWVTLLVGVLVVAGMGWYGATSLLDDGGSDDTDSPPEPACTPATKHQAHLAQRAFARRYAEERWVSGYGVREADGGSVIYVVTTRSTPDDLPQCVEDVPVVYSPTGPFRGD